MQNRAPNSNSLDQYSQIYPSYTTSTKEKRGQICAVKYALLHGDSKFTTYYKSFNVPPGEKEEYRGNRKNRGRRYRG